MLVRLVRSFFSLYSLLITTLISAQTWGLDHPRWTYDYFDFCQSGKVQWTMVGDTVIQDNICQLFRKDYEFKSCSLDITDQGTFPILDAMYEKNQVVYWYNHELEAFDTLFWFGATPGQTWSIIPPSLYPGEILYLVTDTSSMVINGSSRKVLNVQYEIIGSSFGFDDILVEGIGPTIGYMKAWDVLEAAIDGPHEGNSFVCFTNDQIGDYKIRDDANCDIILSNFSINAGRHLSLYPNPAKDQLNISEVEDGPVTIINALGVKYKGFIVNGSISLSNLPVGYYWLRILQSNFLIPFIKVE